MKVDLASGSAIIRPSKGRSFDPAEIPRTVREAGFSAPEVDFTARGRLQKEKNRLALHVPGIAHVFYIEGGAAWNELRGRPELLDTMVQVSGRLHGSHEDQPPGMTVEKFEAVDASRQ